MQINEDGSVVLDFNATLEVAREFHKKHHRFDKAERWYREFGNKYINSTDQHQKRYAERNLKRAEKYGEQKKVYEKWETLYQLLLKNKHMQRTTT